MVNRDLVLMLEDVIKDVCINHTSVEEVVCNIEQAFDNYYKKRYGINAGFDINANLPVNKYVSDAVRQKHFTGLSGSVQSCIDDRYFSDYESGTGPFDL